MGVWSSSGPHCGLGYGPPSDKSLAAFVVGGALNFSSHWLERRTNDGGKKEGTRGRTLRLSCALRACSGLKKRPTRNCHGNAAAARRRLIWLKERGAAFEVPLPLLKEDGAATMLQLSMRVSCRVPADTDSALWLRRAKVNINF